MREQMHHQFFAKNYTVIMCSQMYNTLTAWYILPTEITPFLF